VADWKTSIIDPSVSAKRIGIPEPVKSPGTLETQPGGQ